MKTKFAVAGLGYVGLSNAILLAQHHSVVAVDIDAPRVEMGSPKGVANCSKGSIAVRYIWSNLVGQIFKHTLDFVKIYRSSSGGVWISHVRLGGWV